MADLAYIFRHPVQEARIALASSKQRRLRVREAMPKPRKVARARMALYYGAQDIGHRIVQFTEDSYADEYRTDLLGEDANGDLVAHIGDDLWVPFSPWRPSHLAAALRSRRTGRVNFLDLEPQGSPEGVE